MKFALGCVAIGLVVVAAAGPSLSGQQGRTSHTTAAAGGNDPFNGTWKINRAKSKQLKGEPPLQEDITLRIENGIQHSTTELRQVGGATRFKIDAKYNDGQWYPRVDMETGKPLGDEVLLIKVDDLTHYRVGRDKDGKATGVMMRRLAEDRKSYSSTILNINHEVTLVRVFERQ